MTPRICARNVGQCCHTKMIRCPQRNRMWIYYFFRIFHWLLLKFYRLRLKTAKIPRNFPYDRKKWEFFFIFIKNTEVALNAEARTRKKADVTVSFNWLMWSHRVPILLHRNYWFVCSQSFSFLYITIHAACPTSIPLLYITVRTPMWTKFHSVLQNCTSVS